MSAKYLTKVLGQNEHIHALITESAETISSVNTDIEHALATKPLQTATHCGDGGGGG